MHKTLDFEIEGVSPLILHNGHLADPLNEFAIALKKVSGKRKKTDEDHAEMSRLEWFGGLYLNADRRIIIPGENIERLLVDGAKKQKLGKEFQSAILSDGLWPLLHDGPSDLDALFADKRFVDRRGCKVNNARIMRTRPIFPTWRLKFSVAYLPSVLNPAQVKEVLIIAGRIVGLLDYRPKFGRFEVV